MFTHCGTLKSVSPIKHALMYNANRVLKISKKTVCMKSQALFCGRINMYPLFKRSNSFKKYIILFNAES